ncbi:hypothetical protein M426DRAFT_17649 [Hypoxylon sp. CI-4A]|nr:hypothetical protein M426DRAFT_17649 [Hypoxylon sp. CI-4A]
MARRKTTNPPAAKKVMKPRSPKQKARRDHGTAKIVDSDVEESDYIGDYESDQADDTKDAKPTPTSGSFYSAMANGSSSRGMSDNFKKLAATKQDSRYSHMVSDDRLVVDALFQSGSSRFDSHYKTCQSYNRSPSPESIPISKKRAGTTLSATPTRPTPVKRLTEGKRSTPLKRLTPRFSNSDDEENDSDKSPVRHKMPSKFRNVERLYETRQDPKYTHLFE